MRKPRGRPFKPGNPGRTLGSKRKIISPQEVYSMSKWVRVNPKRSKSKSVTSAPAPRSTLFGQPVLLDGEDAAAYDEIHARMYAAVKPVDVIDEMFIADVVFFEWEISRWRRLKFSLIHARGARALKAYVSDNLEYECYSDYFADNLAEILQNKLLKGQAEKARTLADAYARNESGAVDEVYRLFDAKLHPTHLDTLLYRARDRKELVQAYARHEPDAVTLIDEVLADGGVSLDTLVADAVAEQLDDIERIDRLATIAENRRNAILREIERRREVLGRALRCSIQDIEDAEFVGATPAKRKNAA
jgi:hypothetical protein